MPSAITRPNKNRRSRRLSGQLRPNQRPTPISIVSITPAGNDVTIVFDQFVSIDGIPQWTNSNAALPTAANLTAPNTLVLTYPAGPEATEVNIPADDPAIRNTSGGYVAPSTFPV